MVFFWLFFILLMLNVGIGVLAWLGLRRLFSHLRDNPEAARLFSEHVIAPLLTGEKKPDPMEEPTRTKGTII